MEHHDRPSHRTTWAAAITAALLAVAVAAFLATRGDDQPAASLPLVSSSPPPTVAATTTLDTRTEVVARLREILKVRDTAYGQRQAELLKTIYTSDCPCLAGDGNAIKQLLKDKAVWVGASTSIRVKKLERVNERLWVVIAIFDGSPFRIETESGQLIRSVNGKSELFRFVLAKTLASSEWMLGYAAPVKDN
jgi:hypothetical protein